MGFWDAGAGRTCASSESLATASFFLPVFLRDVLAAEAAGVGGRLSPLGRNLLLIRRSTPASESSSRLSKVAADAPEERDRLRPKGSATNGKPPSLRSASSGGVACSARDFDRRDCGTELSVTAEGLFYGDISTVGGY
jgi:hypothetical protein